MMLAFVRFADVTIDIDRLASEMFTRVVWFAVVFIVMNDVLAVVKFLSELSDDSFVVGSVEFTLKWYSVLGFSGVKSKLWLSVSVGL